MDDRVKDDAYEAKVDRLARKLMHGGDGNQPAGQGWEAARRAARRMLEESEERTSEAWGLDPDDDGVIRRTSSETASTGDSGVTRWVSDGE